MKKPPSILENTIGRGATFNQEHRFTQQRLELDPGVFDLLSEEDRPLLKTEFFKDTTRNILAENDSPDIGFRYSINFYRGCEHGCSYCYARPLHEYLSLSAGLDFESKIFVKDRAPELLKQKLLSPRWVPELILMSGATDCYQPAERQFQLARRCLEVFNQFKNPVGIITKNALITRDKDLLAELAQTRSVVVTVSITSLNPQLSLVMEPRASIPKARLKAIEALSASNIPVTVNVAPIVPGLTDSELPAILKAASEAGALSASYTIVRLPYSVKNVFSEWLQTHFPDRREKVLNAIRDLRGNRLNDPNFGSRMKGRGVVAENIRNLFYIFRKKYGLDGEFPKVSTEAFHRPGDQLSLFL